MEDQNIIFYSMEKLLKNCSKNKEDCLCIMNVYIDNNEPKFSGLCVDKKRQKEIYETFRGGLKKINEDIEF